MKETRATKRLRSGRLPEPDEPLSIPWALTFADLCTLLLSFFVLILSMSSLNAKAVRASFSRFGGGGNAEPAKDPGVAHRERLLGEIRRMTQGLPLLKVRDLSEVSVRDLADPRFALEMASGVSVFFKKDEGSERFSLVFGEEALFQGNGAQLNPAASEVLATVGAFLRESGFRAYVDGHWAAGRRGGAAEDASFQRAQAVAAFLIRQCRVQPDRVALGAYGVAVPIADSEAPGAQAMNRRIEVIFDRSF